VALHSPRATKPEVVSKILYLRERYHFGAGRSADYLKRFHQVSIACSSVHRLLGAHGMSRLPANQKHRPHKERWQRYEKPQPGHRLQVDVKFLERIPGTRKRLYQFTAIDDCTRIRVLKTYDACNQRTAIRFMETSSAAYRSASTSFRPTMAPSSSLAPSSGGCRRPRLRRRSSIQASRGRTVPTSFNGKFRDQHLSLQWFRNRIDAKVNIEEWRQHYNEVRPHSSPGYLTPAAFKAQHLSPLTRGARRRCRLALT
jgi:transposase InsO family protein